MALMLGSLHEALVNAGASEEKATKAAEEVAGYETRLAGIDTRMERLEGRVQLLQWMVAFNIALSVAGFSLIAGFLWQMMLRMPGAS